MLFDLLIFIAVLAALVLAHEFGHFVFARRFGARVEEFGFGFPPRLGGIRKGETLYSFNALPLGGFVKITGEDDANASDPGNFSSKSISARAAILAAGVGFNLLLAYILFAVSLGMGAPVSADDTEWNGYMKDPRVVIVDVASGSSAERAGIRTGDAVIGLGTSVAKISRDISLKGVRDFIDAHRGTAIQITLTHGGEERTVGATLPQEAAPEQGLLGIAMQTMGVIDAPFWLIPWYALKMTALTFWGVFQGFAALLGLAFSGGAVAGSVAGPIGIFSIVSSTMNFGAAYFLVLVAMLSVNLAIVNLIPFPGLDGGRLFFLGIEAVRGRAVNTRWSRLAHGIGFAILILLMVAVTYYDIRYHL